MGGVTSKQTAAWGEDFPTSEDSPAEGRMSLPRAGVVNRATWLTNLGLFPESHFQLRRAIWPFGPDHSSRVRQI